MVGIVEELLYEEESATLDFKKEQYKFEGASPHEKSELLKDILAFANAWRRTDAYILIGVKEVKGGKSLVEGIDKHFDEAQLQEFVNKKTQRPIDFSYIPFELDGKQIGVIRIGLQDRPIYLKNDYGKIKKYDVCIRRGSSTDIASPDEVAKMGKQEGNVSLSGPKLIFGFSDSETLTIIGKQHKVLTTILETPSAKDIPDFGVSKVNFGKYSMVQPDLGKNKDYYRQFAEYLSDKMYIADVCFCIINDGDSVACDVNVELEFNCDVESTDVCNEKELPGKPDKDSYLFHMNNIHRLEKTIKYPKIFKLENSWRVTLNIDKVQPKQTIMYEHKIYVGSQSNISIPIDITIYSDNLHEPLQNNIILDVEVCKKTLDVDKFLKYADMN
jgi:hypothetical protein